MNDTLQIYTSANNRLQRGFRVILHNFGIAIAIALKDAKYNRFAIRPSAPLAFIAPSPKETFVDFDGPSTGRSQLTLLGNPTSSFRQIGIDCVPIPARQYGNLCRRQVHSKRAQQRAGLGLGNMRMTNMPIFPCHANT